MTGPVIPTNRGYAASGWRLGTETSCHLPPGAATCHPKICNGN